MSEAIDTRDGRLDDPCTEPNDNGIARILRRNEAGDNRSANGCPGMYSAVSPRKIGNSTDARSRGKYYSWCMLTMLVPTGLAAFEVLICLLTADLLAGLLHWFEDTWLAPGKNALVDRWVVLPNIEHHERPGGIRECSYWNLNCVCIAIAAIGAASLAACGVHLWQPYLVLLIASQSNQLHAWAHTSNPPPMIAWLQRIKLLQSAKTHAVHHRRPYGVRYCTTTNMLNPILDCLRFWRTLEWIGVRLGARMVRATPLRGGY